MSAPKPTTDSAKGASPQGGGDERAATQEGFAERTRQQCSTLTHAEVVEMLIREAEVSEERRRAWLRAVETRAATPTKGEPLADLDGLIETVLRLDGEATRGPWQAVKEPMEASDLWRRDFGDRPICIHETTIHTTWDHGQLKGPAPVVTTGHGPYTVPTTGIRISDADAALIASYRTAAPALARALRDARGAAKGAPAIPVAPLRKEVRGIVRRAVWNAPTANDDALIDSTTDSLMALTVCPTCGGGEAMADCKPCGKTGSARACAEHYTAAFYEMKSERDSLARALVAERAESVRLRAQAKDLRETQANWDAGTRRVWERVEKAEAERDALLAWLRRKPEERDEKPPGWGWKDDVEPEAAARAKVLAALYGGLTDERDAARVEAAHLRETIRGAPHFHLCASENFEGADCNCWKSRALGGTADGPA